MSQNRPFSLALVGNPNAGKSSVFNRLTGLSQKVGNFPGVTVDRMSGQTELPDGTLLRVVDLPGTYSLHPNSADERIVLRTLLDPQGPDYPDALLYVADITHLERHLLLFTQVLDLGFPVVLGLSMSDLAESENLTLDDALLSKRFGVPVVRLNGRTGEGVEAVKALLVEMKSASAAKPFFSVEDLSPKLLREAKVVLGETNAYRALLAVHHRESLTFLPPKTSNALAELSGRFDFRSLPLQVEETMGRYDRIVTLLHKVIETKPSKQGQEDSRRLSARIDRLLTHKVWGTAIFMGILLLLFQAIFDWASYPMDIIEGLIGGLSGWLKATLPAGIFTDLLTDGVLAGLSGVLVFVPQIAILFALIALLEEVGYMSRAVFLSDSLMRRFGLNGRSMVSLFSGMACAVPAIMATRAIGNSRERLITILVTPFVSCSARIPVYTLLIAFVVPEGNMFGPFNVQGLVMMGLYLLGIITALLAAWVLKRCLRTREMSFLALELPPYKVPDWKNVGLTVWAKVYTFVWEAGKIIFFLSILLWFLSSFGPPGAFVRAEAEARAAFAAQPPSASGPIDTLALEDAIAAQQLEVSFMGYLGRSIEPVIRPLGFDWKIGIALIASFAAREVFVGTMATIYSVNSSGESDPELLRARMQREITPRSALSLLLFYVFALQCMSTLAVVRRETGGWLWPVVQFVAMTGLAYVVSWAVYQLT